MQQRELNLPAIVFDLGGVLINWDARQLYLTLFDGDEGAVDHFLSEVCTSEWNVRQDAGRSLAEATAERVRLFPIYEEQIRAYYDRWDEMIVGPIEGTVQLLSELCEAGYSVSALSNWSTETLPRVRHRFEFLDWFESIVLSGEEKMVKPDPPIYHVLLERIDRRADECLFIDDSLPNVVTARALGFDAIHFESPDQLRVELNNRDLMRSSI